MSANKDLLLEIGCEEIPSRFISPAIRQLKEGARRLLEEAHLQWGSLQAWGTPRRLVLLVSGLAAAQADQVQRIKGPPGTGLSTARAGLRRRFWVLPAAITWLRNPWRRRPSRAPATWSW